MQRLTVLETDHAADRAYFLSNLPALVGSARKLADALAELPRDGEAVIRPRETGRRFNVTVGKAADFLRFLYKVRTPTIGAAECMALDEGVRVLFMETYGVRFEDKQTLSKELGVLIDILALPRDEYQVPPLAEAQNRAGRERYSGMVAGTIELPCLCVSKLTALVADIDRLAQLKPPAHPGVRAVQAMTGATATRQQADVRTNGTQLNRAEGHETTAPFAAGNGAASSGGSAATNELGKLLARFGTVTDDTTNKIIQIASSALSSNEKMLKIFEVDPMSYLWKSPKWSQVLTVSAARIRDNQAWKEHRKNHIERVKQDYRDEHPRESLPPEFRDLD